MIPSPVQFDKEAVSLVSQKQQYVENTYLLYVPQLVTIRFPLSPVQEHSQVLSSEPSLVIQSPQSIAEEIKGKKIVVLKSKKKKDQQDSKKKQRKGKITLMSSRNYSKDISISSSDKINSSFSQQFQLNQLPIQHNHIKVDNVLNTVACNFFECNGIDGIDQYERKPLDLKGSTSTTEKNSLKTHKLKSSRKLADSSSQNASFLSNDSFRGFSKRKNIFDESLVLNTSLDGSILNKIHQKSRSKSRKGIFQKKNSLNLSFSLQRSFSKRKKIFQEASPCSSPKFGIRKQESDINIQQIPRCMLEKWEKFSESEGNLEHSNRLQTVRESRIQESAANSKTLD